MINIFSTYIDKNAIDKVKDVLLSTYISEGKLVAEFEKELENKLKITNPICLNSGTSALHMSLELAGVKEGDEVICPAQTFIATGLAILYVKAKPIFADIDYLTGNISPNSIEEKITSKTKAIMVVHWGGYPANLYEINKIAKKHNLVVIEDAAHAIGAVYKGVAIGSISDFTCFSFQAIKHITTGDGGAICCKKSSDYEKGRTKRWFGIDRINSKITKLGERKYNVKELGYKYHMNDYAAALGLANLENFHKRLIHREKIAEYYRKNLQNIDGITLFKNEADRISSNWLFGMHVNRRMNFIQHLKSNGIMASVIHQRIDRNTILGGLCKDLTNQKIFEETQVHIPIHDNITIENAKYIVEKIKLGW